MSTNKALLALLLLPLVPGFGCSTLQALGDNIGACGAEIAVGAGLGLGVAILGANEVVGDSASTGAQAAVYGAGALGGAAVGYAACVRANQHRRAVEERFEELEARLAEQDAAQAATADAQGNTGTTPAVVQPVTHTVEMVDNSATKVELGGLLFETGSAELSDRGRLYVQMYAETLEPDMAVLVEGHTDDVGSPESNQVLSERRAQAVRDVIIAAGVSPSRVEAKGFGESRPVSPTATREENRRVEIYMIPQRTTTSA